MKFIKQFSNYINTGRVNILCKKYNINNYTINEDGTIDVIGNVVIIDNNNLNRLPLKFNIVTGFFSCVGNNLITLEGCPKKVIGNFTCAYNDLVSLDGGPMEVTGHFNCSNNNLTSLKGCPKGEINGMFECSRNNIKTLEYCPKVIKGDIRIDYNSFPNEIFENIRNIKQIIKYQDDYNIWNNDGSLNKYRFDEMMMDINL